MREAMLFLESQARVELAEVKSGSDLALADVAEDHGIGYSEVATRVQDLEQDRVRDVQPLPPGVTRGAPAALTEDVSLVAAGFDAAGAFRYKGRKSTHLMGSTMSMVDDEAWTTPEGQQPVPPVPVTQPPVGSMMWFNPVENAWYLVPVGPAGELLYSTGNASMPEFASLHSHGADHVDFTVDGEGAYLKDPVPMAVAPTFDPVAAGVPGLFSLNGLNNTFMDGSGAWRGVNVGDLNFGAALPNDLLHYEDLLDGEGAPTGLRFWKAWTPEYTNLTAWADGLGGDMPSGSDPIAKDNPDQILSMRAVSVGEGG